MSNDLGPGALGLDGLGPDGLDPDGPSPAGPGLAGPGPADPVLLVPVLLVLVLVLVILVLVLVVVILVKLNIPIHCDQGGWQSQCGGVRSPEEARLPQGFLQSCPPNKVTIHKITLGPPLPPLFRKIMLQCFFFL